eukprot:TRINITY_DN36702_c0_g1_i2.p1 TRINITY_DN36702_c0_g1~~TRINITY_DN36702_c0_g1_i2.p1  ORF type:complete len:396 (+),score=35.50 TRINITY_DN36702_c0_g1_i2:38-1189(+)
MCERLESMIRSHCPRWLLHFISCIPWLFGTFASTFSTVLALQLLLQMLDSRLVLAIVVMCCWSSFTGLYLSMHCARRHQRLRRLYKVRLLISSGAAIFTNLSIFILDFVLIKESPEEMETGEYFMPTTLGLFGLGSGVSMILYFMHYAYIVQYGSIRRFKMQVKRSMVTHPPPVEMEAGTCVVCLEELSLAALPDDLAFAPARRRNTMAGLLQFPCKHTFHGTCAEHWLSREVSCPTCRCPVPDMGKCTRFVLKPGSRRGQVLDNPEERSDRDVSLREVAIVTGPGTDADEADKELSESEFNAADGECLEIQETSVKACGRPLGARSLVAVAEGDEEVPGDQGEEMPWCRRTHRLGLSGVTEGPSDVLGHRFGEEVHPQTECL